MPRSASMTGGPGLAAAEKPDEPALVTALFSRRFAQPLATMAVRLGVGANAVTVMGGLCWTLSLPLAPLAGWCLGVAGAVRAGMVLWFLCAFLWSAGYLLDVADGSVARMTRTSSRAGFFLDYVFHLLFKPAFLASVGMGLLFQCRPETFAGAFPYAGVAVFAGVLALSLLSIPANGSAASAAAEEALCGECAAGRLVPAGSANPSLWLGSADVADSARAKRQSRARAARTLVQEIASYYLQAPFFSLLVSIDLALLLVRRGAACPGNAFPVTSAVWILLCAALAVRIPVRCVSQWRRLGRATRIGRGGRVMYVLSALLLALSVPLAVVAPAVAAAVAAAACRGGDAGATECAMATAMQCVRAALFALWSAAALASAAGRALSARAGNPVHNTYCAAIVPPMLLPAVFVAHGFGLWMTSGSPLPAAAWGPFGLCFLFAPFLVVGACVASETETAAHVMCEEIGKGRIGPGSSEASPGSAVWRASAPDRAVAPASPRLALPLLAFSVAADALASAFPGRAVLPCGSVFLAVCAVLATGLPLRIRAVYLLLRPPAAPRS